MTAATKPRGMSERSVNRDRRPLAANAVVKKGWLAACDANGYYGPATGAQTEVVVGRFYEDADNTGGANGAKLADIQFPQERWLWLWENDGTNPVTIASRERLCSVKDNQTMRVYVGTSSVGGIVYDVTSEGVWVEGSRKAPGAAP